MRKDRVHITCAGCGVVFQVPRSKSSQAHCSVSCKNDPWRRVDKNGPNGCWTWLGAQRAKGYGSLRHRGRAWPAHQFFYTLCVSPIPAGLEIDHTCRNPRCVNPAHLEPVTRRENVLRQPKVIRARMALTCPNGHPWSRENTYYHPSQGSRVCRACTRAAVDRYQQRKSA